MKQIGLWIMFALIAVSCNDWLDVRPGTEQKDKEQFSEVQGFYDALTGCYMALADQNVYGERLTMSDIEALACLWIVADGSSSRMQECKELTDREYKLDHARDAIKSIYAGLFSVIAQANMIIKYADEQGNIFTDETVRKVIQGEAYAIRAYCQFDALRLFGQMPQGAKTQKMLPYSNTTSIYEMPPYYDFADYVEKLKEDLTNAETLLKDNDPVFRYTFAELDGEARLDNDYMLYRRWRLNYWAVRALRARMELYLGNREEAYRIAVELIDAKGADGNTLMTMSGKEDFQSLYKLCPSECLFCLSKYDVKTYITYFLIGVVLSTQYRIETHLAISKDQLAELFEGEYTASHNRYLNCWTRYVAGIVEGSQYATLSKYWWEDDVADKTLRYQLIPMLRMSEIYLIAMETSNNLEEVNRWYVQYMIAHNVPNTEGFTSLEDARQWIINEYRREFFGEGQMFYTYKRTGTEQMLWADEKVDESTYVLPLPETEFNPNNLLK